MQDIFFGIRIALFDKISLSCACQDVYAFKILSQTQKMFIVDKQCGYLSVQNNQKKCI